MRCVWMSIDQEEQVDVEMKEVENVEECDLSVEEAHVPTAEERISQLEEELKASEDKYLRLYAELENFRKRSRADLETERKYRVQDVVTNLLPILDNFERAMIADVVSEEAQAMRQGMEMIYHQIQTVLKDEGVEVIQALGEQFDPNFHQSVLLAEEPDIASNEVVEELQKGYILKGRVIRPAMVKINQ